MKKKILALALAFLTVSGLLTFLSGIGADATLEYPELMITEIGVDQYGDGTNTKNTNTKFTGSNADRDAFEFLEIYNNSDRQINVYDYMIGYSGAGTDNTEYFEKSVQKYTPFHPGADWKDSPYGATTRYWTASSPAQPENPPYEQGVIAPGEVFVVWMYNENSHALNCTEEQFRSFWSVPADVKIFLLDADGADEKTKFSLGNSGTGTYMVMVQSERFPKRRSADKTFSPAADNKHHNYSGQTFATLDEIISWATVDFRSDPLNAYAAANGGEKTQTNYTLSYLPETAASLPGNGTTAESFASGKRARLSAVNAYAGASVGTLNSEQKAALAKTVTTVVHTVKNTDNYTEPQNNNTRPDLLITRISPDQYAGNSNNVNKQYTATSDPFEFIEIYNNSERVLNVFDYMVGYQGSAASSVSTYFERLIQEYTAIFPGSDWIDGPYTYLDSYWTAAERPSNPAYEDGTVAPGESAVLWIYSADSHKIHAQISDFRAFWSVPDNVKIFLVDGNSDRDKNFNIKNSSTGTYVIMQPSSRFPQRRSDDETLDTENVKRFWSLDLTYADVPEIVSWAVVDFGSYDPLYTFSGKNEISSMLTNYTLVYAPFDPDRKEFVNGFLTTSVETPKRCILLKINKGYADASVGVPGDELMRAINKALGK